MTFDDNRRFIDALEKTGDLARIKQEVDWDLEAGAVVRRVNELKGPAILFEKLKDYSPGYRILGGPLAAYRRLAIALGLPPGAHPRDLQSEYERRTENPVNPVLVSNGPCQENVLTGAEVDLYRFPAPMIHGGDGGRYIATWHAVIMKDPDTAWVNWGMYRLMVFNRNHTGIDLHYGSHGGKIFFPNYFSRKEPMPMSVAIGMDPLCSLMAASYVKRGESEVNYAGGLRGKPVELVKCRTNDLLVPAHSEIVLEGKLLPFMAVEGPFGEFPGYRHGMVPHPVFRVEAFTHRHDPILPMSSVGMPVEDSGICMTIPGAVAIKRRLKENGVPVVDVFVPPETSSHMAIVSIKGSGSKLVNMIAYHAISRGLGELKVMLVNDDVDIFDLDQVYHAFVTKCHPVRGIRVVEHGQGVPLTPFLSNAERAAGKGARVVFDCTWPSEWTAEDDIPPRASFNDIYPPEIKDKVLRNWRSYGLK